MDAEITMPASLYEARSTRPEAPTRLGPAPVVSAAILHLGLIAALGLLFRASPLPPPPIEVSTQLAFMPAEPRLTELAASTLPPLAVQEPAALAPPPPLVVPPGRWEPAGQPALRMAHGLGRRRAPHAAQSDGANQPPPPNPVRTAPTPPPAAAASGPDPRVMADWEARIRQAVQDAILYPASARMLHREGRAEVRFEYDRGTLERVSIAQSSHFEALDNAALAAVTRAAIPEPPAELGPQMRMMQLWVDFKLLQD